MKAKADSWFSQRAYHQDSRPNASGPSVPKRYASAKLACFRMPYGTARRMLHEVASSGRRIWLRLAPLFARLHSKYTTDSARKQPLAKAPAALRAFCNAIITLCQRFCKKAHICFKYIGLRRFFLYLCVKKVTT